MGLKDRTRIERIVCGRQPITSDTALRLASVFRTSADLWMNMPSSLPWLMWGDFQVCPLTKDRPGFMRYVKLGSAKHLRAISN
jgi:hypothetical protein